MLAHQIRRHAAVARLSCLVFLFAVLTGTTAVAQQQIAPEKVVGRQICKICHEAEQTAWERSAHGNNAWQLLDHPKAAGFAQALGVDNIKGASLCTQCHGTQQRKRGQLVIAEGNSCESCHGGAGGAGGWLAKHCDFGFGRKITRDIKMTDLLADRAKESAAHREARDAACDAAGMNRAENAFEIAANCLSCHLVPNEKLIEAGHPLSKRFEFVEWAQGEVRHNFLLDRKVNAEVPTNWTDPLRHGPGRTPEGRKRLMYLAGQLADLSVSLKARAAVTTTKRRSLGDEAVDRILDIQEELADVGVAELQPALDVVAGMDKDSLSEITPQDKQIYSQAAAAVAKAAKAFVDAHADGSKLPDTVNVPSRVKGDPYEP